ncbi:hypothetical protein FQN49_001766 [Arthroderma sp. PD_2]|nr:hypothetical protein FQN49_001766 [Arthroderma sp. PD_2]
MTRPVPTRRTAARRPAGPKGLAASRSSRSYPSRTRNRQRQHRLALGGNTRSQRTLTQLNFVLPQHYPDNNFQLLGEEATQDDNRDDSTEWPPGRTKDNGQKRKRQHRDTDRPNRTLTQIVNVDWSLAQPDAVSSVQNNTKHARKRRGVEMDVIPEEPGGGEEHHPYGLSSENIQRADETSQTVHAGRQSPDLDKAAEVEVAHGKMLPPPNPVTPRKRTRWVVPSSQSPESPEITLNSPRTPKNIRYSPIRWPLAYPAALRDQDTLSPSPDKRRRSLLRFDANDYDSQVVIEDGFHVDDAADAEATAPTSPTSVLSSPRSAADPSVSFKEDIDARLNATRRERQTQCRQSPEPKQQEQIIYETDGELDPESLCDEAPQLPEITSTRSRRNTGNSSAADDQYPLQPVLESNDDQSSQNLPASTYMSDTMSLFYTRQPMSYVYEKFPTSQYPPLATKDLPESVQDTEVIESSQSNPPLTLHSGNETTPIEQVRPQQNDGHNDISIPHNGSDRGLDPPRSSPVIQVASSQRSEVEVASSQGPDPESEPRRIITCSQLLTESLMESIPGPPAWTSSSHINDHNDFYDHGPDRV